MGELSELKKARPELVLGVIGCMAKLHEADVFKRLPRVDLVAGPAELYDLPYLLAEIQEKRQRIVATGRTVRPLDAHSNGEPIGEYRRPGVTAFVTIMEGCDKACTYCIVPKTRGQEVSRPAEEILREIDALAEAGYQEVILLGQNVNSYGKRFPDGSGYQGPLGRRRLLEETPEALLDFPALLRRIDASICEREASGSWHGLRSPDRSSGPTEAVLRSGDFLARPSSSALDSGHLGRSKIPTSGSPQAMPPARLRVRFTTSHPFDADLRLFEAMRDCSSVCGWLHLPAQSGSNRILRAMRRGYTAEAYLKKVELLRGLIPEISLSTDIIVGFPGETEEDFEATERLLREVRYDYAYIFKYSPRPGTDAAARDDDVPQEVKEARNQRLLDLQEAVRIETHRAFEGRTVEVLVERAGKAQFGGQWFGRTRGNHGVLFEGPADLLGRTLDVRIHRSSPHSLFGTRVAGRRG